MNKKSANLTMRKPPAPAALLRLEARTRKATFDLAEREWRKGEGKLEAGLMALDPRKDWTTDAMDIQLGGNVARPPATLTSAEVPKDIQRAQKVAFNHYQDNFMVRAIVDGKIGFFNSGCKVLVKGKEPSNKIKKGWQAIWDEYGATCNGEVIGSVDRGIGRYIESVWRDNLVYDTIVSFTWTMPETPGGFRFPLPFTIQPFRCYYTNAAGYPRLKVELDWDKKDLPNEGQNYRYGQTARLVGQRKDADGKIIGEGERWKIMTKGPFGYGFGRPSMASVFRPLGQCTSMEAGESAVGYLARTPLRIHSIGHETKYGPYAGGTQNFYTRKRADAVTKFFKSIQGFAEVVANWDQKTSYLWIGSDPKWFDASKWDTITNRLAWWGQSLAFMYVTKSINPYLFPMFRMEAEAQRLIVKEQVEAMLSLALDTDDLTVEWSSECFTDQRLAFEMTKFLTVQGPLSLRTALRKGGFDLDAEYSEKLDEAGKKTEGLVPLFDASHGRSGKAELAGTAPGARPAALPGPSPAGTPAGRPSGTPDPAVA